jgi:hypothetical protein
MLGACLLMRMGACSGVKEAIQLVRRRRCKRAVESSSQEKFIGEFARRWRSEAVLGSSSQPPRPLAACAVEDQAGQVAGEDSASAEFREERPRSANLQQPVAVLEIPVGGDLVEKDDKTNIG